MVDQAQGDAIDPAQGTQVDHALALIDAKGLGDMGAGGAQHRQQLFAGGIAALFQQVLAEARLGVKRVVDGAHQHQHTHALTALNPAALNQLVDSPAQGVAVNVEARRQLLLGGRDSRRSDSDGAAPAQVGRRFPDSAWGNWSDVWTGA